MIALINLYNVNEERSNNSSSSTLISLTKLIKDKFPFPAEPWEELFWCTVSISPKRHHLFSAFPEVIFAFEWSKSLLAVLPAPIFSSRIGHVPCHLQLTTTKKCFKFVRSLSLLSNLFSSITRALKPISPSAKLLLNPICLPFTLLTEALFHSLWSWSHSRYIWHYPFSCLSPCVLWFLGNSAAKDPLPLASGFIIPLSFTSSGFSFSASELSSSHLNWHLRLQFSLWCCLSSPLQIPCFWVLFIVFAVSTLTPFSNNNLLFGITSIDFMLRCFFFLHVSSIDYKS